MAKYAAYIGNEWQFNVEADSETEALASAHSQNPGIDRVEVVSENEGRGSN